MTVIDARDVVRDLVAQVNPADAIEAGHQEEILAWIDSGQPIFRINKPCDPPQHLAVYFALFDEDTRSVVLVDHRKADAILCPGGHVDDLEDPRHSVLREAEEELRIKGRFHKATGDSPLFLSVTQTRGPHSHVDVTLWFVLECDRDQEFHPDTDEFSSVAWYPLDGIDWSADCYDPHMERFVSKLTAALAVTTT